MEWNTETLTLLAGLMVQAAGTVWWAASLNGKVTNLEDRFGSIEDEQRAQDRALANINTLMARLDERTAQMVTTMDRLEKRLDGQATA